MSTFQISKTFKNHKYISLLKNTIDNSNNEITYTTIKRNSTHLIVDNSRTPFFHTNCNRNAFQLRPWTAQWPRWRTRFRHSKKKKKIPHSPYHHGFEFCRIMRVFCEFTPRKIAVAKCLHTKGAHESQQWRAWNWRDIVGPKDTRYPWFSFNEVPFDVPCVESANFSKFHGKTCGGNAHVSIKMAARRKFR